MINENERSVWLRTQFLDGRNFNSLDLALVMLSAVDNISLDELAI